jgi:hypothetical protein
MIFVRSRIANMDSPLSVSLAQRRQCRLRQREEQMHEKNKNESRPGFKARVAITAIKDDRTLAELAEHLINKMRNISTK